MGIPYVSNLLPERYGFFLKRKYANFEYTLFKNV
jgi:hypothetical protein